ncbi:MAG: exonuclease domain-containing protein [Thermomicrobiales bacterium]|nr:exonuclease domain-containing protein [Thermomicrobiales bacterium]MCO5224464.1 exonuclease domain-containing protein [Thermomicrobiales bacterium]MCO5228901.1 exonuclease domain-containing protein [Thermomicrobiales bacterium]
MASTSHLPEYVALDVETTGLNPQYDDIIEVALIVFNEREEISRYSQLVKPRRALPMAISRLTGITEEMLADAPRFIDIQNELRERIGDRPIVGHNIAFDIGMLEGNGLAVTNPVIDTYTLATGLLHDAPNYQLGTLAEFFAAPIAEEERHRALGDTVATAHVFRELLKLLNRYDAGTLRQIGQFARTAQWKDAWFFEDTARGKTDAPLFDPNRPDTVPLELMFMAPRDRPEMLRPTGNQSPIDTGQVEQLLGTEGPLGDVLAGYKPRPTQITMARRVAQALNKDENLLIEAGTGTGKSLAYLLPSAIFALQRGERVVVSTATIALQDQLYRKDLPDVHVALQEAGLTDDLAVAVMKGRNNYLCLKQWFQHQNDPIENEHDASLRAKILLWLGHTETGDRAELRLTNEEERFWRKYASERGRCTTGRCPYASSNQCFFHRARFNALHAHIVIANHSLVLANAAEGRVLPTFERMIIDEAHHLEDEATRQLTFSITREALEDTLKLLIRTDSGTVGGAIPIAAELISHIPVDMAKEAAPEAIKRSKEIEGEQAKITLLIGELFTRLNAFIGKPRGNANYGQSLRVTNMMRESSNFVDAALIWEQLGPLMRKMADTGNWLQGILDEVALPNDASNPLTARRDDASSDLMVGIDEVENLRLALEQCFNPTPQVERDTVVWVQKSAFKQELSLNSAPLDVSELLNQRVYANLRTVVMTSATMTVDGSFDYIARHVGMEGSKVLDLGSPFDHERSTLIYVPEDMPEPNAPAYNQAVNEALYDTILATRGRALVLFTSHRALRDSRDALKADLEAHNIVVLGQGVDGNSRSLIERLRNDPGTVVFGTSTFWEGVDVVGDALSALIITKFPFAVPTDPIFEARSEQYDNAFMELSLPMAVLKFKQGFGRLIRTENDRGICVILDRRTVSKRYGQQFVQSLPPANVEYGSVMDLPDAAARWVRPVNG